MNYRKLMEKHLGRKLTTEEHVHHKDGNRSNNSLSNLVVLKRGDHINHHVEERLGPNYVLKSKLEGLAREARRNDGFNGRRDIWKGSFLSGKNRPKPGPRLKKPSPA